MYTKGKPTELVADFLDYMLSDEVQGKVVSQLGYIPISEMKVERDWQGNVIKGSSSNRVGEDKFE